MSDVARTILDQLGGRQFIVMTGARDLSSGARSLQFRIGRNAHAITHVRVTLDPSDTYTVEFYRGRGVKVRLATSHADVYAEDLRDLFTRETGLYTSLGTMRGAS